MQFLEELTESMGENVKFGFGHICEGDEYTAGVKWHLGIPIYLILFSCVPLR